MPLINFIQLSELNLTSFLRVQQMPFDGFNSYEAIVAQTIKIRHGPLQCFLDRTVTVGITMVSNGLGRLVKTPFDRARARLDFVTVEEFVSLFLPLLDHFFVNRSAVILRSLNFFRLLDCLTLVLQLYLGQVSLLV